jgi:hypothetical protein
MKNRPLSHETLLDLQMQTFEYFVHETNLANGLVADRTQENSPASTAATGLALSAYPVAVERSLMRRHEAVRRTLATVRFFRDCLQGKSAEATGYQGFYYHFLDMHTGKRTSGSEASTIDTALLLAGMLTCATYFDGARPEEKEIREGAEEIYARTNWRWAQQPNHAVCHGWKPETGFMPYQWQGYCEALVLYVLALGSPTFPLAPASYEAFTASYPWQKVYGHELLHAGPLFIHQLSHIWIDFRGIQDAYMRGKCIDYFENSRRATYVQQAYARDNPRGFTGYDENCWGISASEGPGPATRSVHGKRRRFYGYEARGVPDGPDDGTLSPWAAVASLPFAPEIVLPVLLRFEHLKLRAQNPYGFKATFNMTFPQKGSFWISPYHLALNQGPIILMIENFHSGLVWRLMRSCPAIARGLKRAGFSGGWLNGRS